MTFRKVYLSLLWFALGIVTATAGWAYFSSLPTTASEAFVMPVPLPSSIKPGLALFDYTYPKKMTVGDVGDIRMHITNLHLYTTPTAALTPPPMLVKIIARTTNNCAVVENSVWPGALHAQQVLEPIGVLTAFDWTVTASGPGECNIEFTSQVGNLEEPDPIVIPIQERWGADAQATMYAGVVVAIATLVGALILRRDRADGSQLATSEPPSIVIESLDHWKVEYGSIKTLAVKPARAGGGMVGGLFLETPSWPPPGPQSETGEYPALGRILLRFTNVGASAAVALRIPLRLSFSHLAHDPASADDSETLGLRRETISHVVEYLVPSLAPGSREIFIINETGVAILIKSTGEAFDRPPGAQRERLLSASSPARMILPPSA